MPRNKQNQRSSILINCGGCLTDKDSEKDEGAQRCNGRSARQGRPTNAYNASALMAVITTTTTANCHILVHLVCGKDATR